MGKLPAMFAEQRVTQPLAAGAPRYQVATWDDRSIAKLVDHNKAPVRKIDQTRDVDQV